MSPVTILHYYISPTHQFPCADVTWKPLGAMNGTRLQTQTHPNHLGRTEEGYLLIRSVSNLSKGPQRC